MKAFAVLLFACGLGASPAAAQWAPEVPTAFTPVEGSTATTTGPVIFSNSRIIFGNGERLDLELVPEAATEGYREVYRLSGEMGPLLDGSELCRGEPPAHVGVGPASSEGKTFLHLTFFMANSVGPTDMAGLCGAFNYVPPPDWVAAVSAVGPQSALDAALDSALAADERQEPTPTSDPGLWQVNRSRNPVDDTETVVLSLRATSGQSPYGDPVIFIARCQSNRTQAYAIWNTYVGDDSRDVYDSWKYVTVRIGEEPAREERWGVSTDNEATFAPDWAGDLLKRMLTSDRLVLQLTPHGENPITAIFDTTGLEAALPELAETCNWSF